jgi:hypothetical protein
MASVSSCFGKCALEIYQRQSALEIFRFPTHLHANVIRRQPLPVCLQTLAWSVRQPVCDERVKYKISLRVWRILNNDFQKGKN